jgi:dTDP-4-amino-4,6-dideoxygalactose transaminase
MFYLILPSLAHRQALISQLKAKGILSVFHYVPLHLSDMGRRFGAHEGGCPVTEDISPRLLRLPFYNDLTEEDQASVIAEVTGFSMQPLRASRELAKAPSSMADPNFK